MNNQPISRRKFLIVSGASLAGAILATAGCTNQSAQAPAADSEIDTPSFEFGTEQTMNKRILVAYATRTGSSVGVAAAIGETLSARGFQVDVKPMKENPDPAGYQTVILGSAINGAQWLPEAVEYAKNHQQALKQVPVLLFSVHIMNLGDDETSRKNRLAYLDAVRPLLHPVEEVFFAGMGMNPEDQPGIVRWIYRTFKIGGEGDCRDWEKINGWADTVSLN